MSHPPGTPEERYATIVEALLDNPEVTLGSPGKKGFGSSALQVDGKIFAILIKGKLVVKLPRRRVDALIAAGGGERFDPGHGRLMKEWLIVEPMSDEPTSEAGWLTLAREALEFVAAKR